MLLVILTFGKVGMGIIVRDYDGKVHGTLQVCRPAALSLFTAEGLAFFRAVMFCKETGFTRLFLEGDALKVINASNKK